MKERLTESHLMDKYEINYNMRKVLRPRTEQRHNQLGDLCRTSHGMKQRHHQPRKQEKRFGLMPNFD